MEITKPTRRTLQYDNAENEESLQVQKNFLQEKRDGAYRQMVEYQQLVKRYQDKRVKVKQFQVGDLVLRNREVSQPTQGGKFTIKWEGPYRIPEVVQLNTYQLETLEG